MLKYILLVLVISFFMAGMMFILHWVRYKRRTARCCHGVNCIRKPGEEGKAPVKCLREETGKS